MTASVSLALDETTNFQAACWRTSVAVVWSWMGGTGWRGMKERWSSKMVISFRSASQGPFAMDSLLFTAHISAGTLEENDATKPFWPIKKPDLSTKPPYLVASKRCWYLPDSFGFSQVLIKELGLRHWLLFQLRDSSHNSSQFTSSFELPTSKAIPRSAWGLCSPPFVFDAFVARCWHLLEYLFGATCCTYDSLRPLSSQ